MQSDLYAVQDQPVLRVMQVGIARLAARHVWAAATVARAVAAVIAAEAAVVVVAAVASAVAAAHVAAAVEAAALAADAGNSE